MQPQHTAIMVEPDEVSSSTPCSSSASTAHSHHSRSVRAPAGALTVLVNKLPHTVRRNCQADFSMPVVTAWTVLRAREPAGLAPPCCFW